MNKDDCRIETSSLGAPDQGYPTVRCHEIRPAASPPHPCLLLMAAIVPYPMGSGDWIHNTASALQPRKGRAIMAKVRRRPIHARIRSL